MTDLKNYLNMNDEQKQRIDALCQSYHLFFEDPANATPKIVIHTPADRPVSWKEKLADPRVMLRAGLDTVARHLAIGDDYVPSVRVDFGTAQFAAAFGCDWFFPEDSTPCAGSHPLKKLRDIETLEMPSQDAAWFPKLRQWTDIWLENLPDGVIFQQPDIQSPFNTAHLVRGNDILMDFFDDPEGVDLLLAAVADYMIDMVPVLNEQIGNTTGWFADWGMLWKGYGRLSNCTSDLIGPDLYKKHVLGQDMRVLESLGGGRMHCCGSSPQVIAAFAQNPFITGLDFDSGIHDPWHICEIARPDLSLILEYYGYAFPQIDRLLAGDWPAKRNITVVTHVASVDEAKDLYKRLKASIPA